MLSVLDTRAIEVTNYTIQSASSSTSLKHNKHCTDFIMQPRQQAHVGSPLP